MRYIVIAVLVLLMEGSVEGQLRQRPFRGQRYHAPLRQVPLFPVPRFDYAPSPYQLAPTDDLEFWRQKRARDFWNRTSPFYGDPYYDPLKTSPFSPFRSPDYHPWRTSPFRGDPYYDPYARGPRDGSG